MDVFAAARGLVPLPRTVRIGVTGLARSGKTALLTSLAANLLAAGAGFPALPALQARLAGRSLRVGVAAAGASDLPRFDYPAHLAALPADPPGWPARTQAVSLLALDVEVGRTGLWAMLPATQLRLELLDYPGEWLLDLPMLRQSFAEWSRAALARLEPHSQAADFLAFAGALPAAAPADEALARHGHALYVATLNRLREEVGLSLLQPGRFLMPPPGPPPPWLDFFPLAGGSALAGLLGRRYDAYREASRRELLAPGFGQLDRMVVTADVLSALHAGEAAFADALAALSAVSDSLRWRGGWWDALAAFFPALGGIGRVAFAATKSDHVADRQRGNLAALMRAMAGVRPNTPTEGVAIAAMRCTEDVVWTLDGHPVSAVRGRVAGEGRAGRSYPGEVPDRLPDGAFWAHRFLALPDFEPLQVKLDGRAGVPHVGLDALLVFLLEDLL